MEGATFPDWLESISTAIAAIFAIFASIIAYKSYNKDKEAKTKKLNDLELFALSLKEQTDEMKKSNEIESKYLDEYMKTKSSTENIQKLAETRTKEKNKPIFNIESTHGSVNNDYQINIRNDGNTAIFDSVDIIKNEVNNLVTFNIKKDLRIESHTHSYIVLRKNTFKGSWQDLTLDIEFRFFDITKENHYKQIIHVERNHFTIGNVEELN